MYNFVINGCVYGSYNFQYCLAPIDYPKSPFVAHFSLSLSLPAVANKEKKKIMCNFISAPRN